MKTINIKTILLAISFLMMFGLKTHAQNEVPNGIHVRSGHSSAEWISSNIGDSCYATGYFSFAGGHLSFAQGACSFAFGNMSHATQSNAYAMGNVANAIGANSLSLGFFTQANQNGSIVIGSGASYNAPLASSVSGIMLGAGSTLPTLFISKANGSLNTGKVGVGNVTSPLAKLHIVADEYEDAAIFLQPASQNSGCSFVKMTDNDHKIIVNRDGSMQMIALNNDLGLLGSNVSLDGNELSIGCSGNKKFLITAQDNPAIFSNAYRTSEGYFRYAEGPSYAIEFNNYGVVLRTAVAQSPMGSGITNWSNALLVNTNGAITFTGKVGVNTENTTTEYALAVDGGVVTTKVRIQDVNEWNDRVFSDNYRLMPLAEVEGFVTVNRHLPGIPSEAEVKAEGFDMAEMQSALLGKIEELTLYAIRQQKQIDSLRELVTVHFDYDACGNRTNRLIEFSGTEEFQESERESAFAWIGKESRWQASLSDVFAGMDVKLFPNPTEGGFFLSLFGDELPRNTMATLCTIDGSILHERIVAYHVEEFDLGGRPAGVYLINLSSGDDVKTWKIIKR